MVLDVDTRFANDYLGLAVVGTADFYPDFYLLRGLYFFESRDFD